MKKLVGVLGGFLLCIIPLLIIIGVWSSGYNLIIIKIIFTDIVCIFLLCLIDKFIGYKDE